MVKSLKQHQAPGDMGPGMRSDLKHQGKAAVIRSWGSSDS